MIKINKMLGVGVLILAILMAGAVLTTATSTESNDAPEAKVGPGAEVEIMNFTIENDGYSIINDTDAGLSSGDNFTDDFDNVTAGKDADWVDVYSYDHVDGDEWNKSVDFLFINETDEAGYNASSDTVIAGHEYTGTINNEKITDGFYSAWSFTSLDANDGGEFDGASDAIIVADAFTEISIVSDSEDNPIVSDDVVSSMKIYGGSLAESGKSVSFADPSFDATELGETITQNTTYTVNMTLSDAPADWNKDYYNMLANATLTLASGDYNVVNGNTIKATSGNVHLNSTCYDENATIKITAYGVNDPNRIQDMDVSLTSDSDVKTLTVTLEETGADTGIFTADVITSSGVVSGDELHTEDGDTITVTNVEFADFTDTANVDFSKPTDVEVTSPSTIQYKKLTNILSVDYKYTDDNPYQTTIQFVNSDGIVDDEFVQDDASSDPSAVSLDLSNLSEGNYSIRLSVEDAAGNKAENQTGNLLMIDNTGPSVVGDIENNITETENFYDGYYNKSVAFNLTFNLEDEYGEIDKDTVILHYNDSTSEGEVATIDNGTIVNDTATFNATITDEDDGMYDNTTIEFWLEANDTVGNAIENGGNASAPLVSYTVDTEAPDKPTGLSADIGVNCIELNWTATTDDASGVALYNIYRNNSSTDFVSGDYIGNTTSTSYKDESVAAEENYNYTIEAVDNLGHVSGQPEYVSETYKPGAGEAFNIVFDVDDESIVADGLDTTQIDATVEDKYGEQVNNFNISFSTDNGTLDVTDGDYYEVTDGSYTVYLTSATETGMANVTASLEGEDITNTTQVDFVDEEYSIGLDDGWNMMSLPLIPANSSIEAVLEGIDDGTDVESVWAYDAENDTWTSYDKESGGGLEEMVDGKGYWLKTDSSGDMTVSGYQDVKAGNNNQHAYDVYEGWNLIGFKYTQNMNSSEYLGNVATFTDRLKGPAYSVELPDGPMKPGQGYWLAVSQDGTIYAPGYTQEDA